MGKAEEKISQIAEKLAEELKVELVDVEFVKEGSQWFLRIFIDQEEGMDLDTCEVFSRRLGEILDEDDPITQAYRLEVSSPGIERVLKKEKDFVRFNGEMVKISLFEALDGQKQLIGRLNGFQEGKIKIVVAEKEYEIALSEISKANLYWEF